MKKTGYHCLLFFCSLLLLSGLSRIRTKAAETEKEDLNLYATAAVLMDGDSGRVLYGKKEDTPLPMASTTKIMTCILALELGDLKQEVTFSSYASGMPDVQLNAREGENFYLEDLLYSLMLESHNDSAVAIAEAIGGNVEGFAALMNEKAKEIGCRNTTFITPNGLDAETTDESGKKLVHSTTAADLAAIMRYCIRDSAQKEAFLQITRTQSYSFSDLSGKRTFSCTNHNAFLNMMEGALSGKTGFTGNAGYCYVGALERDGKTFIVALLACGWPNNKSYKWSDTKKLMQYGLEHYEYRNVLEEKELADVPVRDGIPAGGALYEQASSGLQIDYGTDRELQILLSEEESVRIEYECPTVLEAPVRAGDQVGKAVYSLEGETLAEYPVLVEDTVEKMDFYWYFYQVIARFLPLLPV